AAASFAGAPCPPRAVAFTGQGSNARASPARLRLHTGFQPLAAIRDGRHMQAARPPARDATRFARVKEAWRWASPGSGRHTAAPLTHAARARSRIRDGAW